MAHYRKCLALVTAILAAPTFSTALEPGLKSRIDEMVEPLFMGEMTVGLVVGAIDRDGTLVAGYGTTSEDGGEIPDGETIFEIAALTKVFCALLLADASERGDLGIDDPAGYFLPALVTMPQYAPNPERQITLLDLASHTAGFPRVPSNLAPQDLSNPYADYTVPQMYGYLSEYVLPREPGAAYEYSNIGMGLLGHVLTLRTGRGFEDLVVERIADPLGMKDTRITLSEEQLARLADGYNADGIRAPNWDMPAIPAAGALRSTVNDLLLFLSANLGFTETPLSDAIRATHQPVKQIGESGNAVAMGWHVQPGGVIWHNGQSGGYHSIVAFLEEMGIGVVALSNSSVMITDKLALGILKTMAGEKVEPLRLRIPVEMDPAVFARYGGTYELPMDMTVNVFREGDHLMIQPMNQAPVRLYPESKTEFFLKVLDAQVEFLVDEETGQATHLIWTQDEREIAGKRAEAE